MDDLRKLLIDYTNYLNATSQFPITTNDVESYIEMLKSISNVNEDAIERFENQFKNSENE